MRISRETLETQQIWMYAAALTAGGIIGIANEPFGSGLEILISPFIAILMYSMFTQIPFFTLKNILHTGKFLIALLIGNFLIVPIVVWCLLLLFPQTPAVAIGVCLVLLTPCIDYVIVFTQLGKGDEKLMLAATPILLVVQLLLLPLYLWVFLGEKAAGIVQIGPFVEAFLFLILLPLLLAIGTQLWAEKQTLGKQLFQVTGWLPVPFMAFVLFVVVASQISKVYEDFDMVVGVVPIYISFLIIMPILSRLFVSIFRLDTGAGRALLFSTATRNSLVVLPLAFALPDSIATLAAAVIVTQTIVELIGELVYIKVIPNFIVREKSDTKGDS
ncbi:MAG: arsenic resistance protein [Lysinibacillus sp.]